MPLANTSEPLELEDVFATFQPQTRARHPNRDRGLRRRLHRPRPVDQHRDRGAEPVLPPPDAGDADAGRSRTPSSTSSSSSSDARPRRWRRWRRPRRSCSRGWPTPSRRSRATRRRSRPRSRRARRPRTSAISSFRVQRPFLADFVDLSVRLRPAVRQLPVSLPRINRAIRVGTPILPRTVPFNRDLRDLSRELFRRFDDPTTLLTLRDLNTTLTVTQAGSRVHRAVPDGLQLRATTSSPVSASTCRRSRRTAPGRSRTRARRP